MEATESGRGRGGSRRGAAVGRRAPQCTPPLQPDGESQCRAGGATGVARHAADDGTSLWWARWRRAGLLGVTTPHPPFLDTAQQPRS